MSDICRGKLTDYEYLKHMIPHHQVAIDISIMHQKKSKLPVMQQILRELVWTQRREINLMKRMLNELPQNISCEKGMSRGYIAVIGDFVKPNEVGLTQTYCDPHFFDPEGHMKHMEGMKLDDKMYIEHMIPHHQVAVDMSKVLLKNTNKDYMVFLAYRIIRKQQEEIYLLNEMKKNIDSKSFVFTSNLLNNNK